MAKLAVVATMKIVEGKRDEMLKPLMAHAKRSRETEPGTLRYDVMLPHDDPNAILLYEVYENPEAFDAHVNGASIQQWRKEAGHLRTGQTVTQGALLE